MALLSLSYTHTEGCQLQSTSLSILASNLCMEQRKPFFSGASQVRILGLEHSLRVQSSWLFGVYAVCHESPWWLGPQKRHFLEHSLLYAGRGWPDCKISCLHNLHVLVPLTSRFNTAAGWLTTSTSVCWPPSPASGSPSRCCSPDSGSTRATPCLTTRLWRSTWITSSTCRSKTCRRSLDCTPTPTSPTRFLLLLFCVRQELYLRRERER